MAHWCGQEGRRCEAIGPPPAFPLFSLSISLSFPQPAEKAIGAEQTNLMAIKHDSPPLHWDFIQTTFTGLCSVLIPASKRRTHACTQTHTPPSLHINMTVVLQVPTV